MIVSIVLNIRVYDSDYSFILLQNHTHIRNYGIQT